MTDYRINGSPEYWAGLYIRLSKEDGDKEESDSVGNQKKLLTEYIAGKKEISLADFYIDDGYTGTNFKRPGFRRMIGDITDGRVNCVIVKDLSRFGRDYIDTGYYLERFFPEKHVRFISLLDGVDSEKQSYDLLLPIKNIFNEQYARDISRKIHATVSAKQKAGDFIGAFACYGYRKHPDNRNKLLIDEEAAGTVRRIFSLYVGGMTKQQIADLLNEEGIPCPSEYKRIHGENYRNAGASPSVHWTYSTIHKMLGNEMYMGNMIQGKKHQKMHGRQQMIPRERWIRVNGTHEALISPEMWERTQQLLGQKRRSAGRKYGDNLFAGLIKCGDCKKNMILNRWKCADGHMAAVFYCGTYKRYGKEQCTPHAVPGYILEDVVRDDLRLLLANVGYCHEKVKDFLMREMSADSALREISRLERELSYARKRRQTLYEDYKDGLLSREEFIFYREDYEKKEKYCIGRLRDLRKKKKEEEKKMEIDTEEILDLLQGEKNGILDRTLVLDMIDRIEVYENGYLEIFYRFEAQKEFSFNDYYPKGLYSGKQ